MLCHKFSQKIEIRFYFQLVQYQFNHHFMITQNIIIAPSEVKSAKNNDSSWCSIILLFKEIVAETNVIPLLRCFNQLQTKKLSNLGSIGNGKLISKKMRLKLIAWLQKLTFETFEFSVQTFLLAIKILDQYLSTTNESPSSLQLIGSASLYLAAKTYQPTIVAAQCYVVASANIFTEKDLCEKEMEIYQALNYNTNFPSLLRVYKTMQQNIKIEFFYNCSTQNLFNLIKDITKNIDFLQYRNQEIICMVAALAQVKNRIPNSSQILQCLKASTIF